MFVFTCWGKDFFGKDLLNTLLVLFALMITGLEIAYFLKYESRTGMLSLGVNSEIYNSLQNVQVSGSPDFASCLPESILYLREKLNKVLHYLINIHSHPREMGKTPCSRKLYRKIYGHIS